MDTDHLALLGVITLLGYVYYRQHKTKLGKKPEPTGKLYLPFMVEQFPYDGPVEQLTGISHANSKH